MIKKMKMIKKLKMMVKQVLSILQHEPPQVKMMMVKMMKHILSLLQREPPQVKITALMNSRPHSFTPKSLGNSCLSALTHTPHTHTSTTDKSARNIVIEYISAV